MNDEQHAAAKVQPLRDQPLRDQPLRDEPLRDEPPQAADRTDKLSYKFQRLRERLRAVHPECLLFIEGSPWDLDTVWEDPDPLVVNARHWYDIATLASRRFDAEAYHPGNDPERTIAGWPAIAAEFAAQLGALRDINRERMGDPPMLIGEFGVPFEMNGGAGFAAGEG